MKKQTESKKEKQNREANSCLSMGVGLGALSAGAATLTGVVCPLCYIIVPGLIGLGAIKKYKAKSLKESPANETV